jgi:Rnl2 family RNA ligase
MKFRKYNSLENSSRKKFVNQMMSEGLVGGTFVVQEKVHGSNFSIWYDGETIKGAKRTEVLDDLKDFYNAEYVVNKYRESMLKLYEVLANEGVKEIAVYGELYGGFYGHPDVERVKEMSKIQKGIDYNPENDLYAFDILADGEYLSTKKANSLFEACGFFYAKTIFEGTLTECFEHPNLFESKVPGWLDLPAIEENVCEGVVIRPSEPLFFNSGSRVILKNKNDKWTEKSERKEREKTEVKLSGEAETLWGEMSALATENRLRNVLSKLGTVTETDFGKLLGLFNADLLEDFNKDFEEDMNALEKPEKKALRKRMNNDSAKVIRGNFLNIVDGLF